MKDYLRRLSWKTELIIVLAVAFGWTLPVSVHSLITPPATAPGSTPPISDNGLWGTILFELLLFSLLLPFLRLRGWTPARLGIQPSLRGCLQGAVLAIAAYGLYFAFAMLIVGVWPEVGQALAATPLVGGNLSWTTILVVSSINPFFEEIFVCGYVISVFTQPRDETVVARGTGQGESAGIEAVSAVRPLGVQAVSMATAVNISAAIRLSYHFYQGVAGVIAVVPVGLLFGYWFARTRQLWPLIVAHAILDFVGLASGAG